MIRASPVTDVAQLRLALARLETRQHVLRRRHDEQVAAVGLAKARATARPAVDALLEAQQAETHHRTVGAYARMLTALVREVLNQDIEIGLDLYTDRGMPSLDVFALQNGGRIDIMDGCGGALTNVVCLGLRAIATVRSGLLRFLVLDEADCWIKPEMVPGFYRVLHQLAATPGLNFQILAISHHDVGLVTGDADPAARGRSNLLTVTGDPRDPAGSQVQVRAGAPAWPDDTVPGLRGIRLRGFAAFADADFPLSPGVNALSGDNGLGKSRVLRFLRAVAYGDGDDGDVRHGARRAEGEVRLAQGRVLHYSREPRRNPVNLWRLTEANGRVADIGGVRCEEGGRTPPAWVAEALGIARIDGLDLQLSHQKSPVFLLGEPASRRALVLSAGGESGLLRDMIRLSKTDRAADGATVKSGEAEIGSLRGQLSAMPDLDELQGMLRAAEIAAGAAGQAGERLAGMEALLARLLAAEHARDRAAAVVAALEALPQPPQLGDALATLRETETLGIRWAGLLRHRAAAHAILAATTELPDAMPEVPLVDPAEDLARRIEALLASQARAAAVLAAVQDLPEAAPGLSRIDPAMAAIAQSDGLQARRGEAAQGAAAARTGELAAAVAIADLLSSIGNLCPLCGTPGIGHQHLLREEAA